MPDTRHLEIAAQNGSAWPNSLGVQFFTSLRRHSPDVAQVRSLGDLATVLTEAAEQAAEKPLDRDFFECAARTLAVQFAANTIRRIQCECATVCESPIELAISFALAVVGLETFDTVLFDLPAGVVGNADSDTVLRISHKLRSSSTG